MTIELGSRSTEVITNAIEHAVEIMSSSLDWPAWVQAIGSILAILLAIGLAWWESHQRRIERRELRRENELAELTGRARFFNMVSHQLNRALNAAESISADEQSYSNDERKPTLAWESWARQSADKFQIEVVERLDRIAALPLTSWPDIESGIIFGDAVRCVDSTAKDLRERISDPKTIEPERQRDHYTWALNLVTEWSEFSIHDFAEFICIRNHAVEQARQQGLNIRYADRDAVEELRRKKEVERRASIESGNARAEMHSEIDMLRELRKTIRPSGEAEGHSE